MVASTRAFRSRPTRHALAVFEFMDALPDTSRASIRRALYNVGGESERDIRTRLTTGSRSGRLYKVRGRIIRSSAPGEHPARRSGKLARSTDYAVRGAHELEVGIRGRFRENYPAHLEFGTRKMERRPYIEPASNRFAQDLVQQLFELSPVALHRGRGRPRR